MNAPAKKQHWSFTQNHFAVEYRDDASDPWVRESGRSKTLERAEVLTQGFSYSGYQCRIVEVTPAGVATVVKTVRR